MMIFPMLSHYYDHMDGQQLYCHGHLEPCRQSVLVGGSYRADMIIMLQQRLGSFGHAYVTSVIRFLVM